MKYVYQGLSWAFGLLFGLLGLGFLADSPYSGICLIAASLLSLPPVRNAVYSKTNKELSASVRVISVFVLFIACVIFSSQSDEKKSAELAAKQAEEKVAEQAKVAKENIDYFKSHREEIISSVSKSLAEKNYPLVLSQSNKYLPVNDAELSGIYSQAKIAIDEIKKAEKDAAEKAQQEVKTKEILENLKNTQDAEYKANKDLYQQLVNLNPDNKIYKEKLDRYALKLSAQLEKERQEQEKLKKEQAARLAKFGEPPTQSSWDGSYYPVEQYLKRIANDPDSIKMDSCTGVYHTEKGWLVGCDYRGKNAFGGMIRQSNWFTIVHDQVVKMHDASAYKM